MSHAHNVFRALLQTRRKMTTLLGGFAGLGSSGRGSPMCWLGSCSHTSPIREVHGRARHGVALFQHNTIRPQSRAFVASVEQTCKPSADAAHRAVAASVAEAALPAPDPRAHKCCTPEVAGFAFSTWT